MLSEPNASNSTVSFNAFNAQDPVNNKHIDVQDDHYMVVREIGAAGAVLLKNVNSTLPLKICDDGEGVRSIVLVGTCLSLSAAHQTDHVDLHS